MDNLKFRIMMEVLKSSGCIKKQGDDGNFISLGKFGYAPITRPGSDLIEKNEGEQKKIVRWLHVLTRQEPNAGLCI